MRLVAVVFTVLFALAAMPAAAHHTDHDECSNSVTAPKPCIGVVVPAEAGSLPVKGYYVWLAVYQCAPKFEAPCSGRPADGSPVLGFAGIVYEETNSLEGLQRTAGGIGSQTVKADAMVLL